MNEARKGVAGKPRFARDDKVVFTMGEEEVEGIVAIVDAWGTFEQNEEPSYDILVERYRDTGEPCLLKHIGEQYIVKKIGVAEIKNERKK